MLLADKYIPLIFFPLKKINLGLPPAEPEQYAMPGPFAISGDQRCLVISHQRLFRAFIS